MAEVEEPIIERKRKILPKLGVGQNVEVRSTEDGFLGSWHLATVIASDGFVRQVQYDHILSDDCSGNLIESVKVSPMVDGVIPDDKMQVNYRGVIRPLPPPVHFGRWFLTYGQCVDYFYRDAWWEGVIFDHEDCVEERRIFFPDMGDELKAQVDNLRITQEWDEVTGKWKPRGSWKFLEVIEEINKLHPLLVSVKQIWYEVRVKNDFGNLKEWTSSLKDIWRKLIKEVVHDNTKLSVKQFFCELNSSLEFAEGGRFLEFSEPALEAILNLETYLDNVHAIVPFTEATCNSNSGDMLSIDQDVSCSPPIVEDVRLRGNVMYNSTLSSQRERQSVSPNALYVMHPPNNNISGNFSITKNERPTCTDIELSAVTHSRKRKRHEWQSMVGEAEFCPEAISEYKRDYISHHRSSMSIQKLMKHLLYLGWKIELTKDWRIRKRYIAPGGKMFYSLPDVCKVLEESCEKLLTGTSCVISLSKEPAQPSNVNVREISKLRNKRSHVDKRDVHTGSLHVLKKGKESRSSIKVEDGVESYSSHRVLRSIKRAQQAALSSSSHQTPRTVISWLIDNNLVLPRTKVQYRGKDGHPMAEGRITLEGIKCNCCQKVYGLSNFEVHVGSGYGRPSANIFLEDGRSLLECQLQMKHMNSVRNTKKEPPSLKKSSHLSTNDDMCSVCHYGGELVLCDECPSSFHPSCLGMKEVPDGDWFCPTCCCEICGHSRYDKNKIHLTDSSVLICCQCEHKYHVRCMRNKDLEKLDNYREGSWFCNKRCEQIFFSIRHLLGKPMIVGVDNLTWTLLKYTTRDDSDSDAADDEYSVENYSRLSVALEVMHECFEPVKEPHSRRDLVEDVIFSRWSRLNRLNFQGFYTALLERNDEVITVATVRIYGEKVAEVPLVATRFQYRRLGMCRILMNELEKKLMELGVQRLLLPAVPSVLDTWTTSFGFSVMSGSDRLNFLKYTFLDFQGTVMCQKLLQNIPSVVSSVSTEAHHTHIGHKDNVELDRNSAVSEVFQAEQIEGSEIVEQGSAEKEVQ